MVTAINFRLPNQSTAAADTPTVTTAHPRVWLTPERLTQLKDYATRNDGYGTEWWQRTKSDANTALNIAVSPDDNYLPSLGLVGQITGATQYCQRAAAIMTAVAQPNNHLNADSYYEYRTVLPNMTAGYDWCYDSLSSSQRKNVAKWLMDRADEVWPESNSSRAGAYKIDDASSNYFYGYLTTASAALAVFGDDARAANHINLGLTKYNTLVLPYLRMRGQGGVFTEGNGYDSTFRLALILDAYKTAAGVDLINSSAKSFFQNSIRWRIYSTTPYFNNKYPFGDQPSDNGLAITPFDWERAVVPMAALNDDTLRGYAKYWLNAVPLPADWYWANPWIFLYYDEDLAAVDYRQTAPGGYYFAGPGIVLNRFDWNADSTYWGFTSGPLRDNHMTLDANGFAIYKEGWLTGGTNIWATSGVFSQTEYQNNFTFNGLGQAVQTLDRWFNSDAGTIIRNESTPDYAYVVGDATPSYVQNRAEGGLAIINDYVRKIAAFRDDIFLIYDRIGAQNKDTAEEWHLQSRQPISLAGNTYQFDNGHYRLVGEALLPADSTLGTNPIYAGATGQVSNFRLNETKKSQADKDYFLNVLRILPIGRAQPLEAATAVTELTDQMDGARIGSQVVMFGRTERIKQPVAYWTTPGSDKHYIFDLLPNSQYTITGKNENGDSVLSTSIQANAYGTLIFSNPASDAVRFVVVADGQTSNPTPAKIQVQMTSDKSTVKASDTIVYTIAYKNIGEAEAQNQVITVKIPTGTTYINYSADKAEYETNKRVLTWNIGALAPNAQGQVTFRVKVDQ